MQYDSLIIGSSPLMLLEAIYLTISGKKVIIVEKNNYLGGAWYLLNFFEHKSIESGCHIWYRDKKVYNFLKNEFRINMESCYPQPIIIFNNVRLPYKWKPLIHFFSMIKSFKRKRSIINFIRTAKQESSIVSQYFYPKSGSVELMKKLFFLVEKMNIKVIRNQATKKIVLNEGALTATLNNNKKIHCLEVVAGSHSELGEVYYDGKIEHIKNNFENSNHTIHILIKGHSKKSFSYIHLIGNDKLIRVSDLTFQLNKGCKDSLFCIQITDDLFKEKGNTADTVAIALDELKRQNLVIKNAEVVKYKFSNYTCQYRNFEQTKNIKYKIGSHVRFLNTINLIYSFGRHIKRWKVLEKNRVIKSYF